MVAAAAGGHCLPAADGSVLSAVQLHPLLQQSNAHVTGDAGGSQWPSHCSFKSHAVLTAALPLTYYYALTIKIYINRQKKEKKKEKKKDTSLCARTLPTAPLCDLM